jgi:hypothetical protein
LGPNLIGKKKLKVGEIVIREIFDLNSIKKLNL